MIFTCAESRAIPFDIKTALHVQKQVKPPAPVFKMCNAFKETFLETALTAFLLSREVTAKG
ncbi:hypothetical protein [Porphyromonas macacae]|uniref:hypothetical protein n=1 Tax=Porphyromonas macacae TaxID=28115 RepID=UPI000AB4B9F9|nr:hypothetical protein [Porphyromonas macacae]